MYACMHACMYVSMYAAVKRGSQKRLRPRPAEGIMGILETAISRRGRTFQVLEESDEEDEFDEADWGR